MHVGSFASVIQSSDSDAYEKSDALREQFTSLSQFIHQEASTPHYGSFVECTLEGIVQSKQLPELHASLCTYSDVQSSCSWVEYTLKREKAFSDIWETRVSYAAESKLWMRQYLDPHRLKGTCSLRHYGSGYTIRADKNARTTVRRVVEAIVEPAMCNIFRMLGFRITSQVYAHSTLYHNKYGNTNHVMVIVSTHFLDKEMTEKLFEDAHLVRVIGHCTNDTQYDAIESNVCAFAAKLKKFVCLEKFNTSDYKLLS